MLVGGRDKVNQLKEQGVSVDQIVAARLVSACDSNRQFVINPDLSTRLVYAGL